MRALSSFLIGVSLGVVAAVLLAPAENSRSTKEEEWDVVDEASWESFPASDPPAY